MLTIATGQHGQIRTLIGDEHVMFRNHLNNKALAEQLEQVAARHLQQVVVARSHHNLVVLLLLIEFFLDGHNASTLTIQLQLDHILPLVKLRGLYPTTTTTLHCAACIQQIMRQPVQRMSATTVLRDLYQQSPVGVLSANQVSSIRATTIASTQN